MNSVEKEQFLSVQGIDSSYVQRAVAIMAKSNQWSGQGAFLVQTEVLSYNLGNAKNSFDQNCSKITVTVSLKVALAAEVALG